MQAGIGTVRAVQFAMPTPAKTPEEIEAENALMMLGLDLQDMVRCIQRDIQDYKMQGHHLPRYMPPSMFLVGIQLNPVTLRELERIDNENRHSVGIDFGGMVPRYGKQLHMDRVRNLYTQSKGKPHLLGLPMEPNPDLRVDEWRFSVGTESCFTENERKKRRG